MRSTAPTLAELQRAKLEERIKEHKKEVARLREIYGDPKEALDQWAREHFTLEDWLYARSFVDGLTEADDKLRDGR
jgi:hypothetical protein